MTSTTARFDLDEGVTIDCRQCDGTGQVDKAEHLDLDSITAVRAELIENVASTSEYGLTSTNRADRMLTQARIGFLASRLTWLESCDMNREQRQHEEAVRIIKGKIEAGELVYTAAGGLIETKPGATAWRSSHGAEYSDLTEVPCSVIANGYLLGADGESVYEDEPAVAAEIDRRGQDVYREHGYGDGHDGAFTAGCSHRA